MSFVDDNAEKVLDEFSSEWSNATIKNNQHSTGMVIGQIFEESLQRKELKLLLKGTKFQLKVWEALLRIPFGSVSSYQNIATSIGQLGAIRAVGSAVGANPVAFIIPCHRVIRSQGLIGQYHWGTVRKTAMIGWERSRLEKKAV